MAEITQAPLNVIRYCTAEIDGVEIFYRDVLYLDEAAFVTGEVLHVDGGQHAGCW
jgi:hypothetical protein